MPVFNCERTIKSSLYSLLSQTYSNWELLIVDDCSSDNTYEIVSCLSENSRVKLYKNNKNKGLAWCLNFLIDISQGEYIARMDGDDIAAPNRIEKQIQYLQSNPQCDLVGSRALIFETNSLVGLYPFRESHKALCDHPLKHFLLPHPTWVARKRWLSFFRYDPVFLKAEDYDLLLRSHQTSHFHCLPDILLAYRQGEFKYSKYLQGKIFFFKAISNEILRSRFPPPKIIIWFSELLKLIISPIIAVLYKMKVKKLVPIENQKVEVHDLWLHVFLPLLDDEKVDEIFLNI